MRNRQLYIVFGNPATPAQDGEFNDWHNNIHIPDVLGHRSHPHHRRRRAGFRAPLSAGTTP
jgi:hypothetical protein